MGHLGGAKSIRSPTKLGRVAAKFFSEFSLYTINMTKDTKGPLNTFRGGVGSSTIDYIGLPLGLRYLVSHSEVLVDDILNLSDHNAVRDVLEIEKNFCTNQHPRVPRNIKWSKLGIDIIRSKYTNAVEEFCNSLILEHDVSNLSEEGIDSLVDVLTDSLVTIDKQLPRSKYAKHIRPFWNQHLSDLKRDKVIKYTIWKAEGCPRDSVSTSWCAQKDSKRKFRREI